MGWLRASNNNQTPTYTGLQLNTSVNTMPIAIVWGESKIAPNVIWYNNFQTIEGSSSSGGKGGFFSSDSTTPTYSADLIMALCEGPIAGVNQIWKDQSVYTLGELDLILFEGATPQDVWSYLESSELYEALAYQGTAYACAASYQLGSNADIQPQL